MHTFDFHNKNKQQTATSGITHYQSSTYFMHIFDIKADSWYYIERDMIAICPPDATIAARKLLSIESFMGRPLRFGYRHNCVVGG
jgi:hypothetical protein